MKDDRKMTYSTRCPRCGVHVHWTPSNEGEEMFSSIFSKVKHHLNSDRNCRLVKLLDEPEDNMLTKHILS